MDIEAFSQLIVDRLSPYVTPRWCITGTLALAYLVRIVRTQTHAVIAYGVGVYLLHIFVLFATPKDKDIPDPFEALEDEEYSTRNTNNDFRPFVRKLPEFSFWGFSTGLILTSLFLSLFEATDIPVCVPLLVVYFVFMVGMTVHRLMEHSRRFGYSLFFHSKSSLDQ